MKLIFRILSFIAMFISSCNAYQQGRTETSTVDATQTKQSSFTGIKDVSDGCIQPIDDFVYSSKPDLSKPVPGEDLIVNPSPPWEMVTTLPKQSGDYYLFSRTVNGEVEIWIERPATPELVFEFLVYQTQSKTWKTVSAEIENSKISVGKLFTTKDGSLWGQTGGQFVPNSTNWKSALVKYDESSEKFYFHDGTSDIVSGEEEINQVTNLPYWNIVLQDRNGIFWILVHKDAIYSYDPERNQTQKHIGLPDTTVLSAAISPNADIFYLKDLDYFDIPRIDSVKEMQIFRFSTTTNGTERVSINLEPWPFFSNMLVDHNGRLWLDGIGFRDTDGAWYQIQRSSVFITNKIEESVDSRWKPPSILMESSDGRMWFRSSNGTVWLSLEKRQWCWFTTYKSYMVEDTDNNLWMTADGNLYKLDLKK